MTILYLKSVFLINIYIILIHMHIAKPLFQFNTTFIKFLILFAWIFHLCTLFLLLHDFLISLFIIGYLFQHFTYLTLYQRFLYFPFRKTVFSEFDFRIWYRSIITLTTTKNWKWLKPKQFHKLNRINFPKYFL